MKEPVKAYNRFNTMNGCWSQIYYFLNQPVLCVLLHFISSFY